MNILALDYGRVHIGMALGDKETKVATPFKSLSGLSRRELIKELREVITAEGVDELVVGLPMSTRVERQDAEQRMQEEVGLFADELKKDLNISITMVDERFTSEEAKRLKLKKSTIDGHALAAMLILQTYFERLS